MDHLPNDVAHELRKARQTVAIRASIDERLLLPAKERYIGTFYKAAGRVLSEEDNCERHVIILSGGYGLLQADEPIGIYDAVFRPAWWPRGLLQRALLAYVKRHDLAHVRAFVAASTAYRRVMENVSWHGSNVEDAILVSPIMRGGGGLLKTPRALGEAFCAAVEGTLSPMWTSSDGLPVAIDQIAGTARPSL